MATPAEILRAMAERVDRNREEEFAGCIVIIPPADRNGQEGESIELLLIDPARDLANFWSTAKSKAAIAADEFVAQQQVPALGGYR